MMRRSSLYAAPSDFVCTVWRQLSEVLLFTGYLQGAWSTIMHRLDLSMTRCVLDETVARGFSVLVRRVSAILLDLLADLQERVTNLTMHWCRNYLFQVRDLGGG
jgi:hypothetical protein